MYRQKYDIVLPTTIPLLFNCTSCKVFNLEVLNTGINPFSSVKISTSFTNDGIIMDWLTTSIHFDPAGSPMPRVKGLHGDNIFNLAPGSTGIISFDSMFLYSILVEIETDNGKVLIKGYGE